MSKDLTVNVRLVLKSLTATNKLAYYTMAKTYQCL